MEVKWSLWMDERFPRRINSSTFHNKHQSDTETLDIEAKTIKRFKTMTRNLPPMSKEDGEFTKKKYLIMQYFSFVESETKSTAASTTSLFSAIENASNRSNDTWCEQDMLPFVVTPETVTIPPQQKQRFTVTFKPQDVFQYFVHLDGKVTNLSPDLTNISVLISGRSILPIYHFDLERVDIAAIREGRKLCKEVTDENTQVVMFEAIGISKMAVR